VASSDVTTHGQKDLDVVMLRGAERLVVILDDTEPVWAANRANLVQVKNSSVYTPGSREKVPE
jgi:hypothetical protein